MSRWPDRWLVPVELTSTTRTLVVEEATTPTPTTHTINLQAGWYWCHRDDAGAIAAANPGLLALIEEEINAVIGGSVTFRALPDPQHPAAGLVHYGLARTGGDALTLKLSSGSFTLPRELLGFASDDTTDAGELAGVIRSRRRPAGVWHSWRGAWWRHPKRTHLYDRATEDVWRPDADTMSHGSYVARMWRYGQLPAAALYGAWATRADYARGARRRLNDTYGGFEEVFARLLQPGEGTTGATAVDLDVLVVFDAWTPTGCDLLVDGHAWETVRMLGAPTSLDEIAPRLGGQLGDMRQLDLVTVQITAGGGWDGP